MARMLRNSSTSTAITTACPPFSARVSRVDPAATPPQKRSEVRLPPIGDVGIASALGCQRVCAHVIGASHCEWTFGPVGPL